MATNTGNSSRKGSVKNRSQVYNPSTGNYIKRDLENGRFISVKTDGKPFKGVRKEENRFKSNPNIDIEVAKKSENAVIAVLNKRNRTK